jgi:hypothetical protein
MTQLPKPTKAACVLLAAKYQSVYGTQEGNKIFLNKRLLSYKRNLNDLVQRRAMGGRGRPHSRVRGTMYMYGTTIY